MKKLLLSSILALSILMPMKSNADELPPPVFAPCVAHCTGPAFIPFASAVSLAAFVVYANANDIAFPVCAANWMHDKNAVGLGGTKCYAEYPQGK